MRAPGPRLGGATLRTLPRTPNGTDHGRRAVRPTGRLERRLTVRRERRPTDRRRRRHARTPRPVRSIRRLPPETRSPAPTGGHRGPRTSRRTAEARRRIAAPLGRTRRRTTPAQPRRRSTGRTSRPSPRWTPTTVRPRNRTTPAAPRRPQRRERCRRAPRRPDRRRRGPTIAAAVAVRGTPRAAPIDSPPAVRPGGTAPGDRGRMPNNRPRRHRTDRPPERTASRL